MKTIMILTIVAALIVGCSDDDGEFIIHGFALISEVSFNILNEDGDDLLDSVNSGYYPVEEMKLYYLINGEKKEVYDANMYLPRNIGLSTEVTPYRLRVFTYDGRNCYISEEDGVRTGISIAYLELNKEETDTIKTEWESKEGWYFIVRKVWYNGELHNAEEAFSVIKSN